MDLKFPFEPLRTVQAAAQVVKAAGGSMDYEKLLNVLYLADRTSLIETGSPITGDQMFLSDQGTYGLFTIYCCMWEDIPIKGWELAFMDEDRDIRLQADPGDGQLSDYDIDLLQKEYESYKGSNPSFLPEWKLPRVGQETVLYPKPEDILRASGFSEEDVVAYQERYAPIAAMDKIRIIR
jgi:hypothetical protein